MHELRLVLIVVGALAIIGLLVHGFSTKKGTRIRFYNRSIINLSNTTKKKGKGTVLSQVHNTNHKSKVKKPNASKSLELSPSVETIQNTPFSDILNTPSVQDTSESDVEVIIINVHSLGDKPFIGRTLFASIERNGLLYGDMDIFHRYSDLSKNSKSLFSVANMIKPGTFKNVDFNTFKTPGLSFFMTLPCFWEAHQNFKLMLKTAQQVADDLGGNVLDDSRNLMTPDRLLAYRKQIQDFKITMQAK
ncbi:cell division protein ZipA [Candidatus Photodesmus anomalopis]|uniref:cell division protein ZipA n=1 Tax=Candidatus Photodesmus anomalopis TaxID=28176 RepID=UPI000553FB2E|nr:cell division protein ZipA [Candidatus Photodesmus katoptron]